MIPAEQYSVMAREADELMHQYLVRGEKPLSHIPEQSRYYLGKRISDYQRTGDIKPLLKYHAISYKSCSECGSIVLTNPNAVNPQLMSVEEMMLLLQAGVPIIRCIYIDIGAKEQ